jgi:hypothetical protein
LIHLSVLYPPDNARFAPVTDLPLNLATKSRSSLVDISSVVMALGSTKQRRDYSQRQFRQAESERLAHLLQSSA